MALLKRDQAEAERQAAQYVISSAYARLDDLLNDPRIEVVYVTSANSLHEEHVIAAAEAHKHVLCEKPLATSAAACERMIATCHNHGVKLMVAQPLRYSGAILELKDLLDSGELGEIIAARASFTYDAAQSTRSWLWDPAVAGGGALLDVGIHCLDTFRFLFGEVRSVKSFVKSDLPPPSIEKTVLASLAFSNGILGEIFCSYEIPYSTEMEVLGSQGRVRIPSFTLPWQNVDMEITTQAGTIKRQVYTGNMYGALVESFSDAIRGIGPVSITGEEGLINLQLIEAIYASGNDD